MRKHRRTQHYKRYRYRCDKCGHGMEKESYLKTHKCERVRRKEVTDLHPGTEAMMIPPKSPQDTNNVQVPVPPPPRQQPRNNMVPLRQPEMVENQVQHTPENSHADNMAAAPSQHMPYNTVMPHLDYNHPVPMAPTSSHMMPGGQGGLDLMQRSMHDMRDLRWLTSDPDTTAMGQPDHNNPPMGLLPPEPPQNSGLHFMAYASQFASRISEMPQDFSQHWLTTSFGCNFNCFFMRYTHTSTSSIAFLPRKHEAFTQCCFDVGPASKTVGQHWNGIGWMPCVCWVGSS